MGTKKEITETFVRPDQGTQRDHVVKDLSKLTKPQLLEMRDRQKDILQNKSFLAKLPDKGQRIKELYEKILKALLQKDEIEQAANLFSELNISSKGTRFVTNLEWTGEMQAKLEDEEVQINVEDETDPLKIIAQARAKQKIVKVEVPEPSLITEEDLKDIERVKSLNISSDSGTSTMDGHTSYLCAKEGLPSVLTRPKFKPYQTTITNVHDPDKETKKVFKYSEITAATPPHLRHPGTKMLTLQDSIELQAHHNQELKETQKKDAEARLAERVSRLKARDFVGKDISEFFKTYRVVNESSDEDGTTDEEYDSAEEVLDIDAQEDQGGVNFTVQE